MNFRSCLFVSLLLPALCPTALAQGPPRLPDSQVVVPGRTGSHWPPPGIPGRVVRLTDGPRGLWVDQGSDWMRLSGDVADAREFGARGDGVTMDTAALQQALDSGSGVVLLPAGRYLVRTLEVPSEVTLLGAGATLVPVGNPAAVLRIDARSSAREHVQVRGLSFDGSAGSLIQVLGPARFCLFEQLRVRRGSGHSIVQLDNDSSSLNGSRVVVRDLDARISGFDHAVHVTRGAVARNAGVSHDTYLFQRINHWADLSVVRLDAPCPFSRIEQVYGGLFAAASDSVVQVQTDVGTTHNLLVSQVFMETWTPNTAAVRLTGVEASMVEGAEASLVNPALWGVRAVHLTEVRTTSLRNPMIRHAGSGPGTTPPGYYPAVELASDCEDNLVEILDVAQIGNRVLDNGIRNRIVGDRGDRLQAGEFTRQTLSGASGPKILKDLLLKGGELGAQDGLRLTCAGEVSGVAGSKTLEFHWGGAPIPGSTLVFPAGSSGAWSLEAELWNLNATSQRIRFKVYAGSSLVTHELVTATVDTSQDARVQVVGGLASGSDAVHADLFLVEPLRNVKVQ